MTHAFRSFIFTCAWDAGVTHCCHERRKEKKEAEGCGAHLRAPLQGGFRAYWLTFGEI